jgi:hypothetical protein
MRILNNPEWNAAHPGWRWWHTLLLYVLGAGLLALGISSVWGGYMKIPDRPSPRHVVGLPFAVLGLGIVFRVRIFVWAFTVLSALFCFLVVGGQFSQLISFGGALNPQAVLGCTLPLLCGIVLIRGMRRESKDSNDTSEGIRRPADGSPRPSM